VDGQPAQVVTSDSVFDLAILRRDDRTTPGRFLVFAAESVRLNADITISGFPLADRLGSLNVNRGSVSGLQGLRGNPFQLQISAPVQRGNSGGPVVNAYGQVVAIVVSKLDALALAIETGEIPQNVNFAIRAELVQALLAANSIGFTVSSDREIVNAENLADLLQESTAFVRCRLGG
jgi:serine protease Do